MFLFITELWQVANTKGENRKTLLRGVMSNVDEITADSTLG